VQLDQHVALQLLQLQQRIVGPLGVLNFQAVSVAMTLSSSV